VFPSQILYALFFLAIYSVLPTQKGFFHYWFEWFILSYRKLKRNEVGEMMSNEHAVEMFRKTIPLFQALGDPVRQDLVLLLAEKVKMNVTDIANQSPMSRPTVSHHLKILRGAGIVGTEKRGKEIFYFLTLDQTVVQLKQLINIIEQECIL
jgi:ArsR family transcriptional regulator, arsenate/arsenite/antimonite-responsive transcriptional repressor